LVRRGNVGRRGDDIVRADRNSMRRCGGDMPMMRRYSALLLPLMLALVTSTAQAAEKFYKCTDGRGRTSYGDLPCMATPQTNPTTKPNTEATKAPADTAKISASMPKLTADRLAAEATASDPADPDRKARRDAAARSDDCMTSVRQMAVAGAGMKLAQAGAANTAAVSKCNNGG
jgi:hypothetical protein